LKETNNALVTSQAQEMYSGVRVNSFCCSCWSCAASWN